jgi:hypothetical protein
MKRAVPLAERSNLDLLLAEDVSFDCALGIIGDRQLCSMPAAKSTIDVLMYTLRAGVKALARDDVRRRVVVLEEQQVHDCCKELQHRNSNVAKSWTEDEVEKLVATWASCHD